MRPDELVAIAAERGLTLATAESLTGGAVASAIVAVPGASAVFIGGVVTYTADAKVSVLGVDAGLIAEHGIVSESVALAMAEGARELFGADIAVATTGVAGPEPHDGKAPGTVCVASVGPAGQKATTNAFAGDREAVREASVGEALSLLAAVAEAAF